MTKALAAPIKRLFDRYCEHHHYGPLLLQYTSIVGLVGLPIFYLIRMARQTPVYDDLWLRALNVALLLGLLLRDAWPKRIEPHYLSYSYVVLVVTLPLTYMFTSLKSGGGASAVANTFMAVFFVLLLTDWRNMIVMLVTGFGLGVLLYVATDPAPAMPVDYVARLPLLIVTIIGGSLFKFALLRANAEQVRQAYGALAGSIAHEMRNPLIQLKHNLERMQEALPEPVATTQDQVFSGSAVNELYRQVAESEQAVMRGLQVIGMTLDEVSAKPLDSSAFLYLSAGDTVTKAVHEYGYANDAERARVSVRVSEDFSFRGDETAYLFVLFNLIKNALYYAPLRPALEVVITVTQGEVRVRDTGPGIAADVLSRVFEPFRSTGKAGGTGLGLAYCQRVVRSFGGEITCESVPDHHTEFVMKLPSVPAEELRAHEAAVLHEAMQQFAGRRVLVVDDDEAVRASTCRKLALLSAQIDEAASGVEALAKLRQQHYDLMVLDLFMPQLDGYAVARAVRASGTEHAHTLPIVAHSSEAAHLASIKARKAGMTGFVSKPASQLALVQALMRALRDARPTYSLAGTVVLVADDNAWSRRAVCAYLRQAGVMVVEAEHGAAVVEQLRSGRPWLAVLMDLHMPGMDGLEAAQLIRQTSGPAREVPIIAMTARSDQAAAQGAAAAGMNDFITKPIDADALRAKLQRVAALRSAGVQVPALPGFLQQPAVASSLLLDADRIDNYRRIGLLGELVDEGLPELERLVQALLAHGHSHESAGARETLHSLLGMTGEMGASALYQQVRQVYVPLVEDGRWLLDGPWLHRFAALADQTVRALREQAIAPVVTNG